MSGVVGQRYGRLLVQAMTTHGVGSERRPGCIAVCDCGTLKEYVVRNLHRGRTRSCGCLTADTARARRTTHGRSRQSDPTYQSWLSMKQRCEVDPHYAGRVHVCARWEASFESFLEDMGDRPAGRTLDRVDNDGDYEPGNCRWATATEQARNRRSTRFVTIDGVTRCFQEWCDITGVPSKLAEHRTKLGWSERDALFRPVRTLKRKIAA